MSKNTTTILETRPGDQKTQPQTQITNVTKNDENPVCGVGNHMNNDFVL